MVYTSDKLIAAICRNAGFPQSQRKFEPEDFLAFLNEELQLNLVNSLVQVQQDYFIETENVPIVASQSTYDFPERAVGWKVDSIYYIATNLMSTRLAHIPRSSRGRFQYLQETNAPGAFYGKGTSFTLVPTIGAAPVGSLQIDYVRIQNELVLNSVCGLISTVADGGLTWDLTVNTLPAYTGGVDVISGNNPFEVIERGHVPVVAGLVVKVLKADCLDTPAVGDWVAETGKTPVPNIPEDLHPVLAMFATIRCLVTQVDQKGVETCKLALSSMIQVLKDRVKDRTDSSPIKILPQNKILNMMR